MNSKHLMTALALVAFSTPAFAANEWYVVKNESTKKCEVTETKADGKTMMEVGKTGFKTKAEAETAMKAAAECK
jgi:hypothetical protein